MKKIYGRILLSGTASALALGMAGAAHFDIANLIQRAAVGPGPARVEFGLLFLVPLQQPL